MYVDRYLCMYLFNMFLFPFFLSLSLACFLFLHVLFLPVLFLPVLFPFSFFPFSFLSLSFRSLSSLSLSSLSRSSRSLSSFSFSFSDLEFWEPRVRSAATNHGRLKRRRACAGWFRRRKRGSAANGMWPNVRTSRQEACKKCFAFRSSVSPSRCFPN